MNTPFVRFRTFLVVGVAIAAAVAAPLVDILAPNDADAAGLSSIQGRKIDGDGIPFNVHGSSITIHQPSTGYRRTFSYSQNPFTASFLSPGTYYVSPAVSSGNYSVSYSVCTNCHDHPPESYVAGNLAAVNMPSGGFIDIWWKYTRTGGTTPPPVTPSPPSSSGPWCRITPSATVVDVGQMITVNWRNSSGLSRLHSFGWTGPINACAHGHELPGGGCQDPVSKPGEGDLPACPPESGTCQWSYLFFRERGTASVHVQATDGFGRTASCGTTVYTREAVSPPPPPPPPVEPPPPPTLINNAECVAIQAPASVATGEQFPATVTMRNTGTRTWTKDSTPHRLGVQNPPENRWGGARVDLQTASASPGQSATFYFVARAPSAPGLHHFDWRMVEEQIQWFGEMCQKNIIVTAVTPPPPPPVQPPPPPVSGVPFVTTNAATNITTSSATLGGSLNPNGAETTGWFEYGTTPSLGSAVGSQPFGSGTSATNFSFALGSLQSNTTYYFRAVAQNQHGTVYGQILSFTTQYQQIFSQPTVSTHAASGIGPTDAILNGSVNPNGSETTAWFEYGLTQSLGSTVSVPAVGSGYIAQTVSRSLTNLAPNTTYYYRIAAQNAAGTSHGSIVSFVTDSVVCQYCPPANLPIVETRPASGIAANSALLYGIVNPNGSAADAWFEWGPTASLGNSTLRQPAGSGYSNFDFIYALSGLEPGTIYYFRAAAQNAGGVARGQILSFTTGPGVYQPPPCCPPPKLPKPPVYYPPTYTCPAPCASDATPLFTFTADKPEPSAGEEINLTLTYRNESVRPIRDAVLRVIFPPEVEFRGASIPPNTQTLTYVEFLIGPISPKSQSAIVVRGKIRDNLSTGSALAFNASLMYRDPADRQQSVNSILTLPVKPAGDIVGKDRDDRNSFLLASLFSSDAFGWLLLLILILLLVALIVWIITSARGYRDVRDRPTTVNVSGPVMPPRQTF